MKIPEYDLNGNIKRLVRRGQKTSSLYGDIDDLTYTYDGNRLKSVNDVAATNTTEKGFEELVKVATEYTYDENGNMITDDNKGITGIDYNLLNLPSSIQINGGTSATTGEIEYIYDAAGTKLSKSVVDGSVPATNYVGNHIYKGNNLAYILTDEGRIVFNGNNYNFEYNLTDHLGNVRIVLKDDGTVLQKNSYYPFGMTMSALSSSSVSGDTENKYLYNGKESEPEFGLETYDFGARQFDKQLGRWYNPDPLLQYDSPYVFCGNNPISMIDPSGMFARTHNRTVVDNNNKIIYNDPFSSDKGIYRSPDGEKGKDGDISECDKIGYEQPGVDYKPDRYLKINKEIDENGNIIEYHYVYFGDQALEPSFVDDVIEIVFTAGGIILIKKGAKWVAKKFTKKVAEEIAEEAAEKGAKVVVRNSIPRSGPIIRSLGGASKAEMLARKFKMNINSPTTRQILNSLDDTVDSFISKFRKSSIRSEFPGGFYDETVEQALRSGNTTVRKLLTDKRFVK